MSGKVSRLLLSASLLAVLAGCNSLGFGGDKSKDSGVDVTVASQRDPSSPVPTYEPVAPPKNGPVYISGKCPQIVIRDEGAVYRTYANGAKDDPQQLAYQASLVQGTRQCSTDGTAMTMTLAVQGRVVAGPAGTSGSVSLPIKVSVQDNDTVLYSDTTNYQAQLPPGQGTGQFIYTDNKIRVTSGAAGFVNVYVSFEQAPPAKPVTTRNGHKKK